MFSALWYHTYYDSTYISIRVSPQTKSVQQICWCGIKYVEQIWILWHDRFALFLCPHRAGNLLKLFVLCHGGSVLDPSPLSKALLPAMMYYSYVFSTVANMTCRQRRRRGEEGGVIMVMMRRRCSYRETSSLSLRPKWLSGTFMCNSLRIWLKDTSNFCLSSRHFSLLFQGIIPWLDTGNLIIKGGFECEIYSVV